MVLCLPIQYGILRTSPRQSRGLLLIVAATLFLITSLPALAAEPLLLVGKEAMDATFLGATKNGELQFDIKGEDHSIQIKRLVRWSTQSPNAKQSEVILTDGSRLVLADSWTGQPAWQMNDSNISVTTETFGEVDLQRDQVRALLLQAPQGGMQRRQFLDRLLEATEEHDTVRLTNRDQWQGHVVRLSKTHEGPRRVHLLPDSADVPLQLPESRIAAILFGYPGEPRKQKGAIVGLRDGSLLKAETFIADDKQLHLRLACGVSLSGTSRQDIVYVRSLMVSCTYLSDLVATAYQHNPSLEIPWPYRRDRNILNGPLQAAGRSYAKGLGMPTAARLTYRLDSAEIAGHYKRFIASVAVDDQAAKRGSVVFRVYLQHAGDWQEAFVSPVVRGGDPPLAVSVELRDAKQLAIVTEFADRGDECDYANWLEARLE